MRIFILLAIAILGIQALPSRLQQWENFKVKFTKKYDDAKEESFRRGLFLAKLQHIEEHNAKYNQGLVTYTIGINQFSDFTEEEMKPYTHGLKAPAQLPVPTSTFVKPHGFQAPDYFDWRDQGVIGAVKNQGGCGSCWAFSSNGAIEAAVAIYQGRMVSLSEQNLVDCVTGNWGCSGGWMNTAFDYIIANGGIDTEAAYPYEAVDNSCRFSGDNIGATITGYINITPGNEEEMKEAVASAGPVAIAIDAGGDFGAYSGGVYYNPTCNDQVGQLTHAIVVVGYGTENGEDYWLVRNSWGGSWGLDGYIKMARNRGNNCGVTSAASYPTV